MWLLVLAVIVVLAILSDSLVLLYALAKLAHLQRQVCDLLPVHPRCHH